ncbi:MAG TPA: DUF952 domain-containing protein [Pseudonocardiaceae bacterium]|nr:DUF952 domain-containing protein [Pseudonocardiaceae bacterium]
MILHIISRDGWRQAVAAGEVVADSLATQGYVHCSDYGTAHLPANLLFTGRTDMMLLVVDPDQVPVRWEPGDGTAPGGPWFPHVYGPIPTSAVVATHDFPPSADGTFALPAALSRVDGNPG